MQITTQPQDYRGSSSTHSSRWHRTFKAQHHVQCRAVEVCHFHQHQTGQTNRCDLLVPERSKTSFGRVWGGGRRRFRCRQRHSLLGIRPPFSARTLAAFSMFPSYRVISAYSFQSIGTHDSTWQLASLPLRLRSRHPFYIVRAIGHSLTLTSWALFASNTSRRS